MAHTEREQTLAVVEQTMPLEVLPISYRPKDFENTVAGSQIKPGVDRVAFKRKYMSARVDFDDVMDALEDSSFVPASLVTTIKDELHPILKGIVRELNGGPRAFANALMDRWTQLSCLDPGRVKVCGVCMETRVTSHGGRIEYNQVHFHGPNPTPGSCSYSVCTDCFNLMVETFYWSDNPCVGIRCPHCRVCVSERYHAETLCFSGDLFELHGETVVFKTLRRRASVEDINPTPRQRHRTLEVVDSDSDSDSDDNRFTAFSPTEAYIPS